MAFGLRRIFYRCLQFASEPSRNFPRNLKLTIRNLKGTKVAMTTVKPTGDISVIRQIQQGWSLLGSGEAHSSTVGKCCNSRSGNLCSDSLILKFDRIFYAILKREIDCFKFGIAYPPWSNSVRIVSLAINLWGGDKRKPQEILSSPCVLDVGWTEISGSEMMLNQNSGTTVHYRLKENTLLGTPGLKRQVTPIIYKIPTDPKF